MSYDDIYRNWGKIMDDMRKGNEMDREIWRKIMKDCEKARKTQEELIRELCEKKWRKIKIKQK